MTFVFKDDKTVRVYRYSWKPFVPNKNKPVIKAGMVETTCLMGVARKCSDKSFVHVPVKGKKDESPVLEPLIKDGKGNKFCLLDGEKKIVHAQA